MKLAFPQKSSFFHPLFWRPISLYGQRNLKGKLEQVQIFLGKEKTPPLLLLVTAVNNAAHWNWLLASPPPQIKTIETATHLYSHNLSFVWLLIPSQDSELELKRFSYRSRSKTICEDEDDVSSLRVGTLRCLRQCHLILRGRSWR